MTRLRALPPFAAFCLIAILTGCSAAAATADRPPTPEPTPTAVPGPGGVGGGSTGSGGGAAPPGGIVDPGRRVNPILGQAMFVMPIPGLIDQHPVSVQLVRASANSNGASAELRWWSGVAPCSALDSVQVEKDEAAKTIQLTVIEGSGRGEIACIDIAQLKATVVDLGALAAGTWTVSAEGDAPVITLVVA